MKLLSENQHLITFAEADPQGILYFARAFDIAHRCLEKFWATNDWGWSYWFQNPEFAVPLRHAECDYHQPLKVGELCTASLLLKNIGESSVEFVCELKQGNRLCAKICTVHVFVDRQSFNKIKVPENIRQAFEP